MDYSELIINDIKEHCLSQPGAYESRPFGEYPICYRVMGKIFAQFNPQKTSFKITLKCDPEKAAAYRQLFPGTVVRGYHCPPVQQPYWNTVDLNTFSNKELVFQMIEEAYAAAVEKFSKKAKSQLTKLSELTFKETDGTDPDFALLCGKLDDALNVLSGEEAERGQYNQYNQRDSIHDVIIVYQKGKPVACGSFKMYDEDHAELKRIFTDPSCRNMGLGSEVVRRLEARAKIKGYGWCILETGKMLEAAHHVYKKAGYKVIENYGQYSDMPDSICMERKI